MAPACKLFLLVGFGLVQPDATDKGTHHASDNDGEADPAGIHLFTLERRDQPV